MSADLLPESVNLFLDDFETSLCLPILVVMVLCTAQFVYNHVYGIGYMIYQNVKKPATEEEERDKTDMMGKLKGLMSSIYVLRGSLEMAYNFYIFNTYFVPGSLSPRE